MNTPSGDNRVKMSHAKRRQGVRFFLYLPHSVSAKDWSQITSSVQFYVWHTKGQLFSEECQFFLLNFEKFRNSLKNCDSTPPL